MKNNNKLTVFGLNRFLGAANATDTEKARTQCIMGFIVQLFFKRKTTKFRSNKKLRVSASCFVFEKKFLLSVWKKDEKRDLDIENV